jgi:hypothetical protein
MLGFVISTIAFSVAIVGFNRLFDSQGLDNSKSSHKSLVLVLATVVSMGVGWAVDELDGDAKRPHKSIMEIVSSGDPVELIKLMVGIN